MRLDSPFRSIFPASLVKRGRHVTVPRVRRTPRINILRLPRRIGGNRSASQPSEPGKLDEIFRSLVRFEGGSKEGEAEGGTGRRKRGKRPREGMEAISGGVREESRGTDYPGAIIESSSAIYFSIHLKTC